MHGFIIVEPWLEPIETVFLDDPCPMCMGSALCMVYRPDTVVVACIECGYTDVVEEPLADTRFVNSLSDVTNWICVTVMPILRA